MPSSDDLVYGALFSVQSFGSFSLSGTDYSARFLVDADVAAQYPVEGVLSESVSDFPTYVRTDPGDRILPLQITIDKQPPSQNLIDALKSVFTPSADIDFLRVRDQNGNVRRMRCKSLGLVSWEGYDDFAYVARLQAPEPVWEDDTPDVITYNVSGSSADTSFSWEVVNAGNEECFPVITLTPYDDRDGGVPLHQMPCIIAWRSPLEGVDSQGLPYPIDITGGGSVGGGWDTTTDAPDINVSGTNVRVWLDGVEIPRWITYPNTDHTAVWCSIAFQPTRQAILSANITGSDTSLSVSSADDLAAFPDAGFVLIDTECIAYQGKTATELLGLKRAQRGTAIGNSHAIGDTVYWIEHDIRLTWGGDVAGLEIADEKPIIDLELSNNFHHYYADIGSDFMEEGLIAPTTLRTGQWIRELRAPANGRRAQYASLAQAAGVVTFTDQLPEAGAPNFDSLSLYTPCFVSSNITGVALDLEVDHASLFTAYGIDEGGFEARLYRATICGELVNPPVGTNVSVVGAPSFNSIEVLADADLTRLTFEARTTSYSGLVADPSGLFTEANVSGVASAQYFQTAGITDPIEVTFNCAVDDGFDGVLRVRLTLPSSTDPEAIILNGCLIMAADLPATLDRVTAQFSINPRVSGKQLAVVFDISQGTTGRVEIGARPLWMLSAWEESSAAVWLDLERFSLEASVNSADQEAVAGTLAGTERTVSYKNVDVHFNPNFTPLILLADDSPCYILNGATLENEDTGESLTLVGVLPIEADTAFDIAKIDASSHILTVLTDQVGDYEQPAGYFADPSNILTWLRLLPGSNTLTFTDPDGGSRLSVRVYLRSRWT